MHGIVCKDKSICIAKADELRDFVLQKFESNEEWAEKAILHDLFKLFYTGDFVDLLKGFKNDATDPSQKRAIKEVVKEYEHIFFNVYRVKDAMSSRLNVVKLGTDAVYNAVVKLCRDILHDVRYMIDSNDEANNNPEDSCDVEVTSYMLLPEGDLFAPSDDMHSRYLDASANDSENGDAVETCRKGAAAHNEQDDKTVMKSNTDSTDDDETPTPRRAMNNAGPIPDEAPNPLKLMENDQEKLNNAMGYYTTDSGVKIPNYAPVEELPQSYLDKQYDDESEDDTKPVLIEPPIQPENKPTLVVSTSSKPVGTGPPTTVTTSTATQTIAAITPNAPVKSMVMPTASTTNTTVPQLPSLSGALPTLPSTLPSTLSGPGKLTSLPPLPSLSGALPSLPSTLPGPGMLTSLPASSTTLPPVTKSTTPTASPSTQPGIIVTVPKSGTSDINPSSSSTDKSTSPIMSQPTASSNTPSNNANTAKQHKSKGSN